MTQGPMFIIPTGLPELSLKEVEIIKKNQLPKKKYILELWKLKGSQSQVMVKFGMSLTKISPNFLWILKQRPKLFGDLDQKIQKNTKKVSKGIKIMHLSLMIRSLIQIRSRLKN